MSRGRRRKRNKGKGKEERGNAHPEHNPRARGGLGALVSTGAGTGVAEAPEGLFSYGHWVNHGKCKKCKTKINLYTWEELIGKMTCPRCKGDDMEMSIAFQDKAVGELKRRRICQKCRSIFIAGMDKGEAFCPMCQASTEEEEDMSTTGEEEEEDDDGKTCAACKGTGKSSTNKECYPCAGSGKIYPEDEEDETPPVATVASRTRIAQYYADETVILSDVEFCSAKACNVCAEQDIPKDSKTKIKPSCKHEGCPRSHMKNNKEKWWESGYPKMRITVKHPSHGHDIKSILPEHDTGGGRLTEGQFCLHMAGGRCVHHKAPKKANMNQLCKKDICPVPKQKDLDANWYTEGTPRYYRDTGEHIPGTIVRRGTSGSATLGRSGATAYDSNESAFCISLSSGWCEYRRYVNGFRAHVCRRHLCPKDIVKNNDEKWFTSGSPDIHKTKLKDVLPSMAGFCFSLKEQNKCEHGGRKDPTKRCLRYMCPKPEMKSDVSKWWESNLPRVKTDEVKTVGVLIPPKKQEWQTETDFCHSLLNENCRHITVTHGVEGAKIKCEREICPKPEHKLSNDRWDGFGDPRIADDWKEDDDTKIMILDDIKRARLARGHLIVCPNCGEDNAPTMLDCHQCGMGLDGLTDRSRYKIVCPCCYTDNDIGARDCHSCKALLEVDKANVKILPLQEKGETPLGPKAKVKRDYPYHCLTCQTTVSAEADRCPTCGIYFAPEFILDSRGLPAETGAEEPKESEKPKNSAEKVREHLLKFKGKKEGNSNGGALVCGHCGALNPKDAKECKSCKATSPKPETAKLYHCPLCRMASVDPLVKDAILGDICRSCRVGQGSHHRDEGPDGKPGFKKSAEEKISEAKLEEGHTKT